MWWESILDLILVLLFNEYRLHTKREIYLLLFQLMELSFDSLQLFPNYCVLFRSVFPANPFKTLCEFRPAGLHFDRLNEERSRSLFSACTNRNNLWKFGYIAAAIATARPFYWLMDGTYRFGVVLFTCLKNVIHKWDERKR